MLHELLIKKADFCNNATLLQQSWLTHKATTNNHAQSQQKLITAATTTIIKTPTTQTAAAGCLQQ
jgi:hypothetical protein